MYVELLQLFIGKINAELLQAVDIQDLEAIYVKQADAGIRLLLLGDDRVDISDDPIKEASVEQLAEGVPLIFAVLFAAIAQDRARPLHSRRAEEEGCVRMRMLSIVNQT